MATDRYIAALEISSSKVIGAVGAIGKSRQLEIIAVKQEKSTDSVRYGQIQNLEETSNMINYVIDSLERHPGVSPREITGVYVGLSGRSVRSIEKEVTVNLPEETEITDSIIERLKTLALEADIDSSLEIVDAVPRIYYVGSNETPRPRGRMGSSISAVYDLIVARQSMQNNIRRVLRDKLELDIKGIVVTPIALGNLVLNEHDKKLGCMLVDIGAETTTVTIYTRGNLVYYATLPMGGRNITLDLKALDVIEDKAEEIKVNFGNAIAPAVQSSEKVGDHKLSKISNYVVARAEEIVTNIAEQVRYAGLTEKDIPEGIVICGGGAKLNGMLELIGKFTGLKVRTASYPSSSLIRLSDLNAQGMECLQLMAIMYEGAKRNDDDCLQVPSAPEPDVTHDEKPAAATAASQSEKKKTGKSFGERFGNLFTRIFTPIGEDDEGDELS